MTYKHVELWRQAGNLRRSLLVQWAEIIRVDLVSVKRYQFSSASEIVATDVVTCKQGDSVSFRCRSSVDRSKLSTRFASNFPLFYALFCYDR
jgi:hypothetical protein